VAAEQKRVIVGFDRLLVEHGPLFVDLGGLIVGHDTLLVGQRGLFVERVALRVGSEGVLVEGERLRVGHAGSSFSIPHFLTFTAKPTPLVSSLPVNDAKVRASQQRSQFSFAIPRP
jgi:hypothetical protein